MPVVIILRGVAGTGIEPIESVKADMRFILNITKDRRFK